MEKIRTLSIDIESRSSADLGKCGVYKYAESPDFDILLFAVSVDEGPVKVYDLACGDTIPEEVVRALADASVIKWAHNSSFERVCLSVWLGRNYPQHFRSCGGSGDPGRRYLDPAPWRCSMVLAAYNGLPFSLSQVGAVLGLEEQKMKEGKDLIRYFCTPSRTAGRTWNLPEHAPEKWELFKKYNRRDVEVEMQILDRLKNYPVPDFVWEEYHLSEEINDLGIMIDRQLVEQSVRLDEMTKADITERMKCLTGLENPNSVSQLKGWLEEHGIQTDSLGKKDVQQLIKTSPPEIAQVLALRLMLAKSSVKKYQAMLSAVCDDGRCHGLFKFYGANRTGRFSSSIIQLQNLYRNSMPDLEQARELVKAGDHEMLSLLYGNVPEVLAQLVRTAMIPAPGYKFIVADFSAIEARVLSHLAGETWRSKVFWAGGDIYCMSASQMFGVPVEKHGVNGHLRQKGKIAELACGYGGSVGALKSMGALEMGLTEDELQPLVDSWRSANPHIVQYWYDIDSAMKKAVKAHIPSKVGCIEVFCKSGMLFIRLPSGRMLAYAKPQIGMNRFGGESITYMGLDSTKKWNRIETFGGKLVENCLAEGTSVLTDCGLVPIESISENMKVWDGKEWVSHNGLIYQGRRLVLNVGGIRMTPEHKILTKGGWIESGKAKGLDWADVPLPDGYKTSGEQLLRKDSVAMPLRVREGENYSFKRSQIKEIYYKILRMHDWKTDRGSKHDPRNEPSSGMGRLALDEAKMHRSKSPCLPQLRRQGYKSLRSLAGKFLEFLAGHGADLAKGARFRQNRQQCGILAGKLPLDDPEAELAKQEERPVDRDTILEAPLIRGSGTDGDRENNSPVPIGSRMASGINVQSTRFPTRVYDIRDCGPRHRFTVWNGQRFCIVRNCTQAISRDILCYAMNTLRNYRIVAHVHDEVIIECPLGTSVEEICEKMGRTPPWIPGLSLKADGYECSFYMKS